MTDEQLLKAIQAGRAEATAQGKDFRGLNLLKLRDFANGEQIGPNFEYYPGLVPDDPEEKANLKKRLVVINHLGPILKRVTSHIIGRDPEWTLNVGNAPLKADDERVTALAEWHKGNGRVHAELKRADDFMRWGGRAYLLLGVPDVYRQILGKDELSRDAADQQSALELIHLDALDAAQAGVIEEDGVKLAYWRAYSATNADGKQENRVEVHQRKSITVYVEQNGNLTPAQGLGTNPRPNPLYDATRPLRFRSLMHEVKREEGPMVTQSDVDLQNGVNTSAGNIIRNNNLGGWRQYYTVNAAAPRDEVTGQKTAYAFGPARVVDVQADFLRDRDGNPITNNEGIPVMLSASVGTFDPVNSQFMRDDSEWLEAKLLGRFNQLWTKDESQVSGESRKQSRAAFIKDLPAEAQPIEGALKWVIETADALSQWIQGTDALEWGSVTPRLFIESDKVDLATLQHLTAMQAAGQLSLESLLDATPGVDDTAAEVEKIKAGRVNDPIALNALRELGWDAADWLTALQKLGYPISGDAIGQARDMSAGAAQGLGQAQGGVNDGQNQADVPRS